MSTLPPWIDRARAAVVGLGPAATGGLLLMGAAAIAFGWANSPWANTYEALWATEVAFGIGDFGLQKPLLLWINDGLMAIFFLLVGLEIKRELLEGTLSSPRRAALPLFAALGGIVLPAAIYAVINGAEGGDPRGWAVPAATDIAFALGILALLGSRIPVALKVILTAVAVVDDLGAVLIIAFFFTDSVAVPALLVGLGTLVGLFALNRMKVAHPVPYILLGAVLWFAVLKSGVHATVAGVALALFIPAGRRISAELIPEQIRGLLGFGKMEDPQELAPDTVVHRIRSLCNDAESPLLRWEHALQPWVMFGVMPIFALANAGVTVQASSELLLAPVPVGIALGLFLGKPLGITFFAWIAVRLGVSELPAGVTWRRLHAVSWLGGIGFTMALFISGLALDGVALTSAKVGLLVGSLAAGIVGTALLIRNCPKPDSTQQVPVPDTGLPASV